MMREEARVLTTARPSSESPKIEKLLAFFGLSGRSAAAEDFWAEIQSRPVDSTGYRLLSSAEGLSELLATVQRDSDGIRRWSEQIHSVFIHADQGGGTMSNLVRSLTNGVSLPLKENPEGCSEWAISGEADDFGGAMGGLRVLPSERARGVCCVADLSQSPAVPLISAGSDAIFFMLRWQGVPICLCLNEKIVDLDDELSTPNFDVRDHLFSAVPIVLYLRWAFPETAWQTPETGACLIIDDPLLKPRHGFVRFRSLLALMERYNFSTNIAFIPWNWRRSDPGTVDLFKENADRFSLSIHGCDHTAAEFGKNEVEQVRQMIATAADRMAVHESRTGLAHDQIMVFPQGVFSETAMRELKRANFTAVVNTEVACSGRSSRRIRISDVWDVAMRSYADFPIYTRRYPQQGAENFAFDILLGKPCLVVIHHDFCQENCEHLVEFIQCLNALKTQLVWRSLKEVVKRSYRQREINPTLHEIEMYGAEILIENFSPGPKLFRIKRRETEPATVTEIRAGSDLVPWAAAGEYLHFEVTLPPGESTLVSVRGIPPEQPGRNGRIHSGLKTGLRRYLSEMRDNYVVPAKSRLAAFSRSS
jgi:hypothetical protein